MPADDLAAVGADRVGGQLVLDAHTADRLAAELDGRVSVQDDLFPDPVLDVLAAEQLRDRLKFTVFAISGLTGSNELHDRLG